MVRTGMIDTDRAIRLFEQLRDTVIAWKLKERGAGVGLAFTATAQLLGNMIKTFVSSIRENIVRVANKYPVFAEKYPFVENRASITEKKINC